jgi:hypothetical protein
MQNHPHYKETNNLLQCLILSQLQVYIIDEIQNDQKFWQQEVKFHSSALASTIIKKHGTHINELFKAKDGEFVGDVTKIVNSLVEKLANVGMIHYGAISEFVDLVIENPSITVSEDEKETLIKNQAVLINEISTKAAKANSMLKALTSRVNESNIKGEELTKEISLIQDVLKPRK